MSNRVTALITVAVLLAAVPASAQDLQLTVTPAPPAPLRQKTGQPLVPIQLRVLDDKERPVPGAEVQYTVDAEAGAGLTEVSRGVKTNMLGETELRLQANRKVGTYRINLKAQYFDKVATVPIEAENLRPPRTRRNLLIVGAGLAAGAIAAFLLTRPGPPTASISTVTPTGAVGHP